MEKIKDLLVIKLFGILIKRAKKAERAKNLERFKTVLFANRILIFRGPLEDTPDGRKYVNGLVDFIRRLRTDNPKEAIVLYIDSTGGSVEVGMPLYEEIRITAKNTPIFGVVNGVAFSMAAVILQACSRRIATRNSRIMIHNIRIHPPEVSLTFLIDNHDQVFKDFLSDSVSMNSRIAEIFMGRSKKTNDEIAKIMKAERQLWAEEALNLGLVDCVI